jgi:hypothetical protein
MCSCAPAAANSHATSHSPFYPNSIAASMQTVEEEKTTQTPGNTNGAQHTDITHE